ncbi:MAG: hypothetical protein JWN14_3924, partial [Chthonomonadales bacterium]|nr:hypothetical protein [Chthonomonadales bacterium]
MEKRLWGEGHRMKWKIGLVVAAVALGATGLYAEQKREMEATAKARTDLPRATADGILLPSGWVLHPAGRQIPTG